MGGGRYVWPHGGGRPEVVLLLHVSYVFLLLAVASKSCRVCLGPSTNRINPDRLESIRLQMPDPTLVCCCALFAMCCAVLSPAPRGKYSKHQPGSPAGSLCRDSPAQREPSQPPAHLIDSPATRIATRHRDRFFLGCVIHAGSRGWYLPHDGNNMRENKH